MRVGRVEKIYVALFYFIVSLTAILFEILMSLFDQNWNKIKCCALYVF